MLRGLVSKLSFPPTFAPHVLNLAVRRLCEGTAAGDIRNMTAIGGLRREGTHTLLEEAEDGGGRRRRRPTALFGFFSLFPHFDVTPLLLVSVVRVSERACRLQGEDEDEDEEEEDG